MRMDEKFHILNEDIKDTSIFHTNMCTINAHFDKFHLKQIESKPEIIIFTKT